MRKYNLDLRLKSSVEVNQIDIATEMVFQKFSIRC